MYIARCILTQLTYWSFPVNTLFSACCHILPFVTLKLYYYMLWLHMCMHTHIAMLYSFNCCLYLSLQKYNKYDDIHMVGKCIQYLVHKVNWTYLNSLVPSSCATCGESGHILIFLKIFHCSRKHFEDL